jgi:FKBP-type peptidyl-prolyl cis-trans isomerase FklB
MNMSVKRTGPILFFIVLLITFKPAGAADTKQKLADASIEDKISYAIGYDVARNLKKTLTINTELFFQGVHDSLANQSGMTEDEILEAIGAYQNLARKKQMEQMAEKSAANKAAGKAFLKANKSKQGITVLESGLQYKVIKAGTGEQPKPEDKVECHYRGTLIDGTEFDSSFKRGQPAVFPVNGVIKGWTEALQRMKVGAKWMLYVPSDLAYGDRAAGPHITPGSTLIFEVELLSIEK